MANIGEVTLRDLKDVYHTTKSYEIKVYSYNGASGLTLGQLLMAVCLERANQQEAETVKKMNSMAENTTKINKISSFANDFVSTAVGSTYSAQTTVTMDDGTTMTAYNFLVNYCGITASSIPGNSTSNWGYDDRTTIYNLLKNKLDNLNSISQSDMIDLQSLINKRDQSYTLASNGIKLMINSGLVASNNI